MKTSKAPKTRWMIKRELTLENKPTNASNSFWVSAAMGWGPQDQGMKLGKPMMQRVLNVHHSSKWYTRREHAHLYDVEGGPTFISGATNA